MVEDVEGGDYVDVLSDLLSVSTNQNRRGRAEEEIDLCNSAGNSGVEIQLANKLFLRPLLKRVGKFVSVLNGKRRL